MRIVHVIGDMGIGGAQRQLRTLMQGGVAEHVVVTWRQTEHPLANGLWHEALPKARRLDPRFPARLRAHLSRLGPDVVHGWLNPASAWAALASRAPGPHHAGDAPWALVTSELVHRTPWHALWPHALADASVADSHGALLRLPSRRARHIAPGVEAPPTTLVRPWAAPTTPFALVLGAVHPHKGQRHAVAAARAAGLPLALVGPVADPAYLAEVIAAGGRWYGATDQPWAWLAAAAVVLVPSLTESAPNVVLEALALGRPVVASAVGEVPRLLDGGRYGRLVPPGDVAALTSALSGAASSPAQAVDAPGWVAREYGRERMVASYAALYAEVLSARRSG